MKVPEPEGRREEYACAKNQDGDASEGKSFSRSDKPRRAAAFAGGGGRLDSGLLNLRLVFDFAHVQSICRSSSFSGYAMNNKIERR